MDYYHFMSFFGLFVLLPIFTIMSISSYYKTRQREKTLREAVQN